MLMRFCDIWYRRFWRADCIYSNCYVRGVVRGVLYEEFVLWDIY